ncbi:MAG: phosphatidylcholine/phosphatidylserine synthase [Microthrixaceae bacterium]|nr:phosphatidylcholine/phosphatidylserine synthase [Microthrixaceae bacterium]
MDRDDIECRPHTAWAIHIFSSLGILAGFLGLLSVLDGSPRAALTWLLVAMIIDGLDGPIARRYEISRVIPHIDGNSLDLMIDYVCCVVAPALFLHRFHMLPGDNYVSLSCVGLILTSSLYVMSNKDIQTEDSYFNGFPAMWNVVVNALFALQARPWISVAVIVVLVVFTFVPLKFVHPIRVKDFRNVTIPVLAVWLAAMLYVTWILDERIAGCSRGCLGVAEEAAQGAIYAGAAWIVGVGVWRTVRGAPPSSPALADGQGKNAAAASSSSSGTVA